MNKKYIKSLLQLLLLSLSSFFSISTAVAAGITPISNATNVASSTTKSLSAPRTSSSVSIKAATAATVASIVYKDGIGVTGYSGQGYAIIKRPSGVAVGDLMFVNISTVGPNDSYTAPAGWALVSDGSTTASNASNITTRLYSKVMTGTDTASYVWTCAPGQGYAAVMQAFSGVGSIDAVRLSSIRMAQSPPSIAVPADGGSTLMYFWINNDQGSRGTAPTGMTFPSAISKGGVGSSSATGFGAYQIGVAAGTYNLQGSMTGSTASAAFAVSMSPGTVTATPVPGSLSLSSSSYSVAQSAGSLFVSVNRSGGSDGAVSVAYSTANGTATAGSDYTATSGTLSWADGDTAAKTFSIPISNATPYTGSEYFTINLGNATGGASLGSPASATATITGSGAVTPGSLALSASAYTVSQSAGSLLVTVNRSSGSSGAVSVQYSTTGGTAVAGTDYTTKSGSLNWADGDAAAKSFSIAISNSSPYSGSKSFNISLSSVGGGATIGSPSSATATINGSATGTPGSVALSASSYAVSQSAGVVFITVNRSGGSSGAVSVAYATANGTATSGSDYTATSGTLSWATGDTAAKSFSVPISNATPYSGSENFAVNLAGATGGATIGSPASATVTVTGSGVPGTLALASSSYAVAQNAGSVTISVNRTGGSNGAVSVAYATANGTATTGSDYTAASGTLSWAAGDTASKSFAVTISNATPYSGSETFTINLSGVTGGATLGSPSTATTTITGSGSASTAMGATAAARLLTQGTFGATIATINAASTQTYDQWFSAQVSATPSLTLSSVVNQNNQVNWKPFWWKNVIQGPDQLRQRVAMALSEIFVTSGQNNEASAYYYDTLVNNAFSNYRTLLERISLTPEMGVYLSAFRNDKANPSLGTHADQNYGREIMQLFSVGLVQLNLDGSPTLDGNGKTIPTYGYNEVANMANVFTGWASAPQKSTGEQAWQYDMDFLHQMVAYDNHHETAAKTIIGGVNIPAGGTTASDLKIALDTLANHPNVGPFLSKQLIIKMVTSNPSPAYVARIASVFNNNGSNVRGDLLAVVRAILTDPEAVNPGGANYGKLREPLMKLTQLWRAFNASDSSGGDNEYLMTQNSLSMTGESTMQSPSVFNFFQPDYVRAGPTQTAGLVVPEFQILNENSLVLTANQFQYQAYQFIDSTGAQHQGIEGYDQTTGSVNLRTAAWENLADNPASLIDTFNRVFLLGAMPTAMRTSLINYVSGIPTTDSSYRGRRVVEAADLVLNSPQYAIQR